MMKRDITVLSKDEMVDRIIHEAFKKAEKECSSKAKNALAIHISDELENSHGFIISYKTLVRAFDKSDQSDGENDGGIGKMTVKAFCIYLGYENYKSFVNTQNETVLDKQVEVNEIEGELPSVKQPRSKWFLSTSLIVIIGILGLLLFKVSGIGSNVDSIANQCLYWEVDRYRPIDCDEVLPQAIAKTKIAFNETLYNDFRKIPNSEVATYSKVFWKGTSPSGEMDYFGSDGVHPLTRKKLVRVEPETIKSGLEKEKAGIAESSETLKKRSKTIGILIFENQNLDREVIGQLERARFRTFASSGNVIASSVITESKKAQLLAGNFSSITKNKRSRLDYICVGTINYSYKKGKLSAETITCKLSLDYDVLSTTTGIKQNELSQSISVSGIGFSKEEAKANALKKL